MKKIITTFAIAIALAVIALAPANAASTPRILSLNASQADGTISVNGTAETHMLAAAISVYAADDTTNALAVETISISSGIFAYEIAMAAGNYKVCAANYDGGDQFCVDLTTTEEVTSTTTKEESTTAGSPETGYNKASDESAAATDNTWMIVATAVVVLIGTTAIILARRHVRTQAKQAKK